MHLGCAQDNCAKHMETPRVVPERHKYGLRPQQAAPRKDCLGPADALELRRRLLREAYEDTLGGGGAPQIRLAP